MNANAVVSVVAALAVGGVVGYVAAPRTAAPEAVGGAVGGPRAAAIEDAGAGASLDALRARVRELEAALAKADASATDADAVVERLGLPVEKGEDGKYRARPPTREEMHERMRTDREKWRKEHPEEAARFEEEMRKRAERRAQRTQSRLEFLASVDTSKMSAKDKATHDEVQALIAKREELREKMRAEGLSEEERGQVFGELRETERALREKSGDERTALFRQTAAALGFTGDDAEDIVSTLGEIIEATEQGGRGPGPGGPGFGGPGFGGPGGGNGAQGGGRRGGSR